MGPNYQQLVDLLPFMSFNETLITIAGTPVSICKRDPTRFALIFASQSASIIFISTDPNANAIKGMTLGSNTQYITLVFPWHGPLVTTEWFASGSFPGGTFTVFEFFYRPGES